jgi:hypothetical protein
VHHILEQAFAILNISDKVPTLKEAAAFSEKVIGDARNFLRSAFAEDLPKGFSLDVVFLGSIARREASPNSDLDYLVLAHGLPSEPKATRKVLLRIDKLKEDLMLGDPGATGMFATVVASADLTERIGLEQDTNQTHSRRILLLEESVSVFQPDKHEELTRKILQRYLADYNPPKAGVPRFLLNDVLRYWRTLAVDYQAKRWEGLEREWGLRYLKFIISRKLAFAGTLVSLLMTEEATENYLYSQFSLPPLARLAQLTQRIEEKYREDLRQCFLIAESFANALENKDFREHAKNVRSREDIKDVSSFAEMKSKGDELQNHLEALFFRSEILRNRSIKYLSF